MIWLLAEMWQALKDIVEALFHDPYQDPLTLPMNQPTPPIVPTPDLDALLPWNTQENCRHNVRAIADLEGLTVAQKDDFSRTLHCESDYDNTVVMFNCEHGFVRSTQYNPQIHGQVLSKDIGICQINSYWHIGPGKDFPSEDYVLQNPEAVVRWSAQVFKISPQTWVCRAKGAYIHYSP